MVHDLPGVGENLQDHLEVYIQYSSLQPVSIVEGLKWRNRPFIGLEWLLRRTGTAASNHFEGGGFCRSNEDVDWPNLMFHFLPIAIRYDGSPRPRGRTSTPTATRSTSARCTPTPAAGCASPRPTRGRSRGCSSTTCPPTDRQARVGRGGAGRARHPQPAGVRAVQRRRDLARTLGGHRRGDPRLGPQGRRDRAPPLVHGADGHRRDVGRRPVDHVGPRHRGPARRRRLRLPLRHQRQHLRPRDDGRREGRRPHRRPYAAPRGRRALLPPPRRHPALPARRPAATPETGHEPTQQHAAALSVNNLWKIFGTGSDKIIGTPDAELSRADLKAKTNCVVGVKDVSFDVAPGEVFVSWASPARASRRWSAC